MQAPDQIGKAILPVQRQRSQLAKQHRVQRVFLALAACPEGLEVPAILSVVASGKLDKDLAALFQRHVSQRQRQLAAHRGRPIAGQHGGVLQPVGARPVQGAKGDDAQVGIAVPQQAQYARAAIDAELRQQPNGPRANQRIVIREQRFNRWHSARPVRP